MRKGSQIARRGPNLEAGGSLPSIMPQTLYGSCQCGAISFTVESHTPVPYQLCLCSICRKVAGSASGAINLCALAETLKISPPDAASKLKKYHAIANRGKETQKKVNSERNFCSECGTHLWVFDSNWPELIHPFAGCIDGELPFPDQMVVLMAKDAPKWIKMPEGKKEVYEGYPPMSINDWHKKHGVWVD